MICAAGTAASSRRYRGKRPQMVKAPNRAARPLPAEAGCVARASMGDTAPALRGGASSIYAPALARLRTRAAVTRHHSTAHTTCSAARASSRIVGRGDDARTQVVVLDCAELGRWLYAAWIVGERHPTQYTAGRLERRPV